MREGLFPEKKGDAVLAPAAAGSSELSQCNLHHNQIPGTLLSGTGKRCCPQISFLGAKLADLNLLMCDSKEAS